MQLWKTLAVVPILLLFGGTSITRAQGVKTADPAIRCLAFSPDGSQLAAAGSNDTANGNLVVWSTATWQLQWGHSEPVGFPRLAFSPNGRHLALSRFAPETKILDAATGEVTGELKGHTNHARCVTYTPDGRQIITGSYDKTIIVWDAQTNKPVATMEGHDAAVYHVAVSPDGARLASTDSRTGRVFLWDLRIRERIHRFERLGSLVPHVAFSPDGRSLAVSSSTESLTLFDTESLDVEERIERIGAVNWTAFSPNSRWLAVASNGLVVRLFDIDATTDEQLDRRIMALIGQFQNESYEKRELASRELAKIGGPAKKQLHAALQSSDAETRIRARKFLRELADRKSAVELRGHQEELESVAFSPDGRLLASGDKAGKVIVWSVNDRMEIAALSLSR